MYSGRRSRRSKEDKVNELVYDYVKKKSRCDQTKTIIITKFFTEKDGNHLISRLYIRLKKTVSFSVRMLRLE